MEGGHDLTTPRVAQADMRRIAILVEGQSEQAFVDSVLQPALGYNVAYLTAIIVATHRPAAGGKFSGGGRWRHYRDDLRRLVNQPQWDLVTTLIDFYAFPDDLPVNCARPHRGRDCVVRTASAMQAEINSQKFLPFVILHELEALVIASGAIQQAPLGDRTLGRQFRALLDEAGGDVEMIDDAPDTSPSKRLQGLVTHYDKIRDGIAILQAADLSEALQYCPGVATWVSRLRADSATPQ